MHSEIMQVVKKREIAKNTYHLVLKGEMAKLVKPGQFAFLKIEDKSFPLRRPISILTTNYKDEMEIIFKILGNGTNALKEQDQIDVFGDLGNTLPQFKEDKKILLIGGGVGLPPLYFLGQESKANNIEVTSILGFLNKDYIYLEEEFKNLGPTYITTDDGSYGIAGLVTEALKEININDYDHIYICGPGGMINYFAQNFMHMDNIYVSLEEFMACGIGACLSCKREFVDGRKRVCKEGPVFRLQELEGTC